MILPALCLATALTLAFLDIARTWTGALAVAFGWLLLVTVTDWRVRCTAKALDGLLLDALGIRHGKSDKPEEA